jgi:hypothetical protein
MYNVIWQRVHRIHTTYVLILHYSVRIQWIGLWVVQEEVCRGKLCSGCVSVAKAMKVTIITCCSSF